MNENATPRPWRHGPLFWEGWSEPSGVRVFEVPHVYPDGAHQPGVWVDPEIGRTREADAALIVEAVNAHDRLLRIEEAARAYVEAEQRWLKAGVPSGLGAEADKAAAALREALGEPR